GGLPGRGAGVHHRPCRRWLCLPAHRTGSESLTCSRSGAIYGLCAASPVGTHPLRGASFVKLKVPVGRIDRRGTPRRIAGPVLIFLEKNRLLEFGKALPLSHARGNCGDKLL